MKQSLLKDTMLKPHKTEEIKATSINNAEKLATTF